MLWWRRKIAHWKADVRPARVGRRRPALSFWPSPSFGPFDPHAHPALAAIQTRAVHTLFEGLELGWVPSEYWDILKARPDPIQAFREFLRLFAINERLVRQQEPGERGRLEQCIGMLLELSECATDLSPQDRATIMRLMRERAYGEAEQLLEIVRRIGAILREAREVRDTIVFPGYQLFLQELERGREHLKRLSEDDAQAAYAAHRAYRAWQERFDCLCQYLDELIAWANANIAEESEYFVEVQGALVQRECVETRLRGDREAAIDDELEQLTDVWRFLVEVMRCLGREGADSEAAPGDAAAGSCAQWYWALERLGFARETAPSREDIKRAYRRLALAHHPDRYPTAPKAVQARHEAIFKELAQARKILEEGLLEPAA
ncbi:MAG: J domain-containing protein [Acidobacteria bacterium]|nr:J domain-containing protein [Acidobacteriota bacterium]